MYVEPYKYVESRKSFLVAAFGVHEKVDTTNTNLKVNLVFIFTKVVSLENYGFCIH